MNSMLRLPSRTYPARHTVHMDIETYSSVSLAKSGVYRYAEAPDFTILLLSYAVDDEPVVTIDMACGETVPEEIWKLLDNPDYLKVAHNAAFERVCLSRLLGRWLDPASWRCTMIMGAYLTLPMRLADLAVALNLTEQKMEEGKELIRYFSVPCKPTKGNGGRIRNLPSDAPDRWRTYKQYNAQDVATERAVYQALIRYPMPENEWALYALDQRINDRGVRIDQELVDHALAVDSAITGKAYARAQAITGMDNPSSIVQLKEWLAGQDVPMVSLAKKKVQEKVGTTEGVVAELLELRLALSKTSVRKYEAMARTVCLDGRIRGMTQFYGAPRTGRFAGRLVQLQNIPQNHLPDLELARHLVRRGDTEQLELLFESVPDVLSDLIRTAFIPAEGCRYLVADFSAIEARTLAWLAGEEWVLDEFRHDGKIYEETAARMFQVPRETIVKGHPNYAYRQKGKQAVLSCGYGGSVGALKAMGAQMSEEDMQLLVDAWRQANPRIVRLWAVMEQAARHVIRTHASAKVGKVTLFWQNDIMFMVLPSGRRISYLHPCETVNRFGSRCIGYRMPDSSGRLMPVETFGGKLVENLTQATARDILCHAMQCLDAAGYPIVFHVHDEVILEVPEGQGSLEEVERIMAIPPDWCPDLPLKADGDELMYYRKT